MENEKQNGTEEWDNLLNHLRQIREQVREKGPLPENEKAEITNAFHRGLAMLEHQVHDFQEEQDAQSGLRGSGGKW